MKKLVIVIPSYNNRHWYQQNLMSVCTQEYDHFRVIYVDDGSSDATGALVEQFIADHHLGHRIQLIRNPVRVGALQNLYTVIHTCDDDEIVLTVDGDDWLAHDGVLQKINEVYADPQCWMTYGQCVARPRTVPVYSREIPSHIIETNTFRGYAWCSSHLRTFYAWLFKRIRTEDLRSPWGMFYPMTWDQAMMFPMLEMSGPRAKFIREVLYIYNAENPLNDFKVNRALQRHLERVIRRQQRYDRL
jgi:glycosyltransferase involved in cell wall biosynthesis